MFWNNVVFRWSLFLLKEVFHQLHTMWWKMKSIKARFGSRSPSSPRYKTLLQCSWFWFLDVKYIKCRIWRTMCVFFLGWCLLGKPKQGYGRGVLWRLEKLWSIILRERRNQCHMCYCFDLNLGNKNVELCYQKKKKC